MQNQVSAPEKSASKAQVYSPQYSMTMLGSVPAASFPRSVLPQHASIVAVPALYRPLLLVPALCNLAAAPGHIVLHDRGELRRVTVLRAILSWTRERQS